ncbi:MAG: hypothetical protein RIQ47_1253 [Bacteroidota bacterium]|jgi:hypothetical protein
MTNTEKIAIQGVLTLLINELYNVRLELKQLKADYYEDEDELESETDIELNKDTFINIIDIICNTDN